MIYDLDDYKCELYYDPSLLNVGDEIKAYGRKYKVISTLNNYITAVTENFELVKFKKDILFRLHVNFDNIEDIYDDELFEKYVKLLFREYNNKYILEKLLELVKDNDRRKIILNAFAQSNSS
jgi:hypothetical protein